MNTGMFRFFRFESWAWRTLSATSEYIREDEVYVAQYGPISLFEERPTSSCAIAEAWLIIGPISLLLGRGFLG